MKIFRSRIVHFVSAKNAQGFECIDYPDGLLIINHGHVVDCGAYASLISQLDSQVTIEHYPNHIILPGFVDAHVHYPQTEMVGAHGEQLLDWLQQYTFPTELKFVDEAYATTIAEIFTQELLRNGTTTALVFATVHPQSATAFFNVCLKLNLRMICGKVLMDRNAPASLCEPVEQAIDNSQALIHQWHNRSRLRYAVTPRFAPTCSSELLKACGTLLKDNPDVYLHTHLSENKKEIDWVKSLFPTAENYLDVYHRHGLLGERSIFAHGIHLAEEELKTLEHHACRIAHCPSSNLFLGSGLFPLEKIKKYNIPLAIGSDIGAGTSFSLFRNLDEAYKIQQLQNTTLSPFESFYLATLGGAKALHLDTHIGNFDKGKEADFIIINPNATPLLALRTENSQNLEDRLFALQTLADDRAIEHTYVFGERVYSAQ